MKKLLVLGSLLLGVYGFYFLTYGDYRQTKEFSLENMIPHHPYNPDWDIRPISSEERSNIHNVLNRKYNYIGCGNQAYVFFSEDQKYVLKFVKQHRYTVPRWIRYLTPPVLRYRRKKMGHKEHTLQRDFTSYKIAFDRMKDDTALIYVHLNVNDDFHQMITLVDQDKKEYLVDAHDYEFILQDMAAPFCPTIENHVAKGDLPAAKEALDSLMNYLYTRSQQGIEDSIPSFYKNFAFMGNRAVQIDIGRFFLRRPERLPTIRDEFKNWLGKVSPELLEYFETRYQALREEYLKPSSAQLS